MISFDWLLDPILFFFQSDKRLFYVYLLSAFLLGFFVIYTRERSFKKSFQSFFHMKILKHRSTQLDINLFLFNTFFKLFIFSFVTITAVKVSSVTFSFFNNLFPEHQQVAWGYDKLMLVYTLTSFVALDFSRFFQHYLFHKIPFLWRFHKVHHTAEVLTPMTLFRTHPLESVVGGFRRTLVLGLLAGFFTFYAESLIGVWAILGVNGLDFLFNLLGSNLRHSHVWLSFGPLNYFLISPAQHQIHHSRDEKYYDTNFGVVLSIWDQMFGTFYSPKRKEFISFGVRNEKHENFKEALFKPFRA